MIQLIHGDCLEKMADIADGSVDMILCDLPYGTTDCKWDSTIPLGVLWSEYRRVTKPHAAIVLHAMQPFTTDLIASNREWFRYTWIWKKSKATGFFNAAIQPLRQHEEVVVFYKSKPRYNPQFTNAAPEKIDRRNTVNTSVIKDGVYDRSGRTCKTNARKPDTGKRYPTSVIEFPVEGKKDHPTQKPVALMEYLIRTYTQEGETVLDNCMGSGTTGVACINTGRKFIGIERDEKYFQIATDRIKGAVQ